MRCQLRPPSVVAYTPSSRLCQPCFASVHELDRGAAAGGASAFALGVVKPSTVPENVPMTTRPRTTVGAWTVIPPRAAWKTFAPERASYPTSALLPLSANQTVFPATVGEPFSEWVPSG